MKKILIFFAFLASMGVANAAVICPTQRPICATGEILECQTTQGITPSGDVRGNWICQDPDNWQPPPPQSMGGNTGNGPINQDQACNGQPQTTPELRACREGIECRDVEGGPAYAGQTRRHAWQCKEWPQVLGGDSQVAPKKCANGAAPVNGKCPDCIETLLPNTARATPPVIPIRIPTTYIPPTQDITTRWGRTLASLTRNPSTPSVGNTANGFSAGAGIVAGDQITCKHTPKYDAFAKCVTDNDPQRISIDAGRGFITEPTLSKLRTATAIDCAEKNGYRTVEDANKDYSCLKANVLDALWGFLTHRKPY